MTGSRSIAIENQRRMKEAVKEAKTLRAPPPLRITYEDGERAFNEWGANCGPGALAAVTGKTLEELRPHLGDFEAKHYTNPSLMFETLRRLGVRFGLAWRSDEPGPEYDMLPTFGLARIQWGGPWCKPGVPMRARYRQTHWISTCQGKASRGVFDVNALESGGWISFEDWKRVIVTAILETYPRADGTWWVTHGIEVFP